MVKLATVIAEHEVNGLAGGIYLPRYDPVVSASRLSKNQLKRMLKIVHPYHNCFHSMVGQTLLLELDKAKNAQVIEFIFDEQSMLKECVQLYLEMKEMMRSEMKAIAGAIIERSDRDVLPLQAADLLAGQILLTMKRSALAKTRAPLEPGSPMEILSSRRQIGMFQAFPPYFERLPSLIDELNRLHDMKKLLSNVERLMRKNEKQP